MPERLLPELEGLTSRNNSFTFIRLVLAMIVVLGHACILGGFGEEPLAVATDDHVSGREIAVQGFFVLSGFLIAKSLSQNASLWRFAIHRIFRIMPALWVNVLLVVFVATPLLLEVQAQNLGYFDRLKWGDASAFDYLRNNWAAQNRQDTIEGLFHHNPEPRAVNGSLWSITLEIKFYLVAALAAAAARTSRTLGLLAGAFLVAGAIIRNSPTLVVLSLPFLWRAFCGVFGKAALFAAIYAAALGSMVDSAWAASAAKTLPQPLGDFATLIANPTLQKTALAFLSGTCCWQYRHFLRWSWLHFSVALAIGAAAVHWRVWPVAMPFVLPYIILFLGARLPFQQMEHWGDYSYGVYIFSFPLQQILADYDVHRHGFWIYAASSALLSTIVGAISWFLIEGPALALGKRLGATPVWKVPRGPRDQDGKK